jgi:hypothetical protein
MDFKQFLEAQDETVEIFRFRDDLPEGQMLGKPGTLYIKSPKTKKTKRGKLSLFIPIDYDYDTQTLIHLRNVITNYWPDYVVERMESEIVPVRMHEYP